jgi:hypothetical protein
MTRIAASAAKLRETFPGIIVYQHNEYVVVDGKKIDAVEFMASAVAIGGAVFDIDEACDGSEQYEANDYLYAQVGDVYIFGYRKKGSNEGREETVALDSGDDEEYAERDAGGGAADVSGGRLPRAAKTAATNAIAAFAPRQRGVKRAAASGGAQTTSGGVRIQYGPVERERQDNQLVMGAISDPYDKRSKANVRR